MDLYLVGSYVFPFFIDDDAPGRIAFSIPYRDFAFGDHGLGDDRVIGDKLICGFIGRLHLRSRFRACLPEAAECADGSGLGDGIPSFPLFQFTKRCNHAASFGQVRACNIHHVDETAPENTRRSRARHDDPAVGIRNESSFRRDRERSRIAFFPDDRKVFRLLSDRQRIQEIIIRIRDRVVVQRRP